MQLMDELIEKVSTIVQETEESIIIDAIYPFAQTVEFRISKEELREAILKYYGKHDHVRNVYKNCNTCIHKNVCFEFWKSDYSTSSADDNVDSMNDSWSEYCEKYQSL